MTLLKYKETFVKKWFKVQVKKYSQWADKSCIKAYLWKLDMNKHSSRDVLNYSDYFLNFKKKSSLFQVNQNVCLLSLVFLSVYSTIHQTTGNHSTPSGEKHASSHAKGLQLIWNSQCTTRLSFHFMFAMRGRRLNSRAPRISRQAYAPTN